MDQFLTACASFPTVVFTVGLGVAFCYWALVILGALDLDLLHHGEVGHHGDAGHVGDGGHHGDGHVSGGGFWHGFFDFLAVGTVPITISLTLLLLTGWVVSMLGSLLVLPLLGGIPALVAGGLLLVAAVAVALPLTGLGVWPLRTLFRQLQEGGHAHRLDLIGKPARITSGTADPSFGTAICLVDGAEHVIRVVTRPGLTFRKDDQVVVVSYDEEADRYLVGPLDRAEVALGEAPAALAAPVAAPVASGSATSSRSRSRPGRDPRYGDTVVELSPVPSTPPQDESTESSGSGGTSALRRARRLQAESQRP